MSRGSLTPLKVGPEPVPGTVPIASPPAPRRSRNGAASGPRSQPRHGAGAGHRGGRPRRRTLDGPGRQGGRRPGRGRRHAARRSTTSRWTASSSSARARRTRRRCSTTASRSATAARRCDIAVDPIDGTTLTALGRPNAIAVIALVGAGHDVRPRAVRVHGEDRGRARGRRRHRPRRVRSRTTCRPWRRRSARTSTT